MSPAFVAAMEDVLDLYAERYDPRRPVVGFDERPLQLLDHTREPIPVAPGRARKVDYEYRRNGTGNVFMTVEPLAGWRHVEVTERRTAVDFAQQMKWLVDEAYADAKVIRVVLDNLNVHTTASLYATFPQRRRAASRASWSFIQHPNMAAGSMSRKANWRSCPTSASIVACQHWAWCARRLLPGSASAIRNESLSTGCSRPRMLDASSGTPTPSRRNQHGYPLVSERSAWSAS